MTKQKKPYQGSARQLKRIASRKPDAAPARTGVRAICQSSGHVSTYSSIRKCADVGGFDYTSVRNCLHGRLKAHSGHTFEATSALRQPSTTGNIARVAELRNKGMSNPEIAVEMGISPKTVPVYASQAVSAGLTKTWHEVVEDLKDDIK